MLVCEHAGKAEAKRLLVGLGVSVRAASRRCKSRSAAEFLLDFLLQRDNSIPSAYGHKDIEVDGDTHTLQPRLRTQSLTALYDKYQKAVADKPKRERVGQRMFIDIAKQILPRAMQVCEEDCSIKG